MREAADALLQAFACSDLETIRRLTTSDLLLVGTDRDELWTGRDTVLAAFGGAYDLGVRWLTEPVAGGDWVFGVCVFTDRHGVEMPARVTMVFRDGLLSHAHYSVAQ